MFAICLLAIAANYTLHTAAIQFLNENGEMMPIVSIRLTGLDNVTSPVVLTTSDNRKREVCQDKCDYMSSKEFPIRDGVFSFFVPIKDTIDEYLVFNIIIENVHYEIHPLGTALSAIASQPTLPISVRIQIAKMNAHQLHNTTLIKDANSPIPIREVDHDHVSGQSTLFKKSIINKRSIHSGLQTAFQTLLSVLSNLGQSIEALIRSILLQFNWKNILNLMEFNKYYLDNVFITTWQSMPLAQQKMSEFVHNLKHESINPQETEQLSHPNVAKEQHDMRYFFIQDHLGSHIKVPSNVNVSALTAPAQIMTQEAKNQINFKQLNGLPKDKQGIFHKLKLMGLNLFGNISTSTFPLTEPFQRQMLNLVNMPLLEPFGIVGDRIRQFVFGNRFEVTFLNIFIFIGSCLGLFNYMLTQGKAPITSNDLISIRKSPHLMNVVHFWLKDPVSGAGQNRIEQRVLRAIDTLWHVHLSPQRKGY